MSLSKPVQEDVIGQMFDKIAPRYDFLNAVLSMRQDRRWRRKMIAAIPHTPGGRLLDVATGTGDVIVEALKQHPEFEKFTGCDIAREMLTLAQRKIGAHPRVGFGTMSAEKLDFPDGSFNALTISFGLRNVVNKNRALEEFHRVLARDGKLLILEFFTPEQTLMAKSFLFYFHHILPRIGGLLSDRQAYSYLPKSVGSFYSADELLQTLKEIGFRNGRQQQFLFGACRLITAERI